KVAAITQDGGRRPSPPIAWSPDGRTLVTSVADEQAIYLWSVESDVLSFQAKMDIHKTNSLSPTDSPYVVDQLEFLPDGTLLTNIAGTIDHWDLANRRQLGPSLDLKGSSGSGGADTSASFALRGNSQEIAAFRNGDTEIGLWNISSGRRIG